MKKSIIVVIYLSFLTTICSHNYYYYYNGQKQYVYLDTSSITLITTNTFTNTLPSKLDFKNFTLTDDISKIYKFTDVVFNTPPTTKEYFRKINLLNQIADIIKANPNFKSNTGKKLGLSNFFYVKLQKKEDIDILHTIT